MKVRAPLAAATLLALAGCGSSSDETAPTEAASEAAPTPDANAALQQFVDTAAASDLYEVEAGKLAQAQGSSQKVKDFGAMMVTDHTASTAALKAAVAQAKPDVTVTPALAPEMQTKLDQLKAANGSRFDDLYSLQQVGAHQDALNLLRDYSINGADPAVRDFATKTAPVVEHHLDEAGKLP